MRIVAGDGDWTRSGRHLVVTGALPRASKRKATLTVPRRPKALALALRKRLGKAGFRRAYRAMRALLRTNSEKPEAETVLA